MRHAPASPPDEDDWLPFPVKYIELRIDGKGAKLDPEVDDGRIRSMRSESPQAPGGGRVLVIVEPFHAVGCAVETGGACGCGADDLFETYIRSK